ncbi:hypothetical protein Enr8_13340 [Blastopirellula retiformator]|uniref:Uncharacterized protein n=1 Tax=Blastopirellula retiformator TaxID=2527970 RepID=A0A5C5VNV0_9BACT|nr:hypothetical protein Enr8_13340 [Blastopirellula retiformator]
MHYAVWGDVGRIETSLAEWLSADHQQNVSKTAEE